MMQDEQSLMRHDPGAGDPNTAHRTLAGATAAAIVLLATLCSYSLLLGTYPNFRNPNERSRILLSVSAAAHGTIAIDRAMDVYGKPQDRAERDGTTYTDKAPGLSLLAVAPVMALRGILPESPRSELPAYWPLRHVLTWLCVSLPAALLPWLLLRRYPLAVGSSVPWVALVFALSTPMLTYSTLFFGHVPAAVLAALCYLLALRPGQPDFAPPLRTALLSGLLGGFAVAAEYPTALIAAVVFGALLARRASWPSLLGFAAGGLIGVAPLLIYNHFAFGAMWLTGYAYKADSAHATIHAQGLFGMAPPTAARLWGVLLGTRRGMLFYCPLLLVVPLGLARMARRSLRDAAPLAIVTTVYVAFAASFVDWHAGWTAAARHLVPVLPLLLFALVEAVEFLGRKLWSWGLLVVLAGMSLCGSLLSVAVTPYFPDEFKVPLMQIAVRSLLDGAAFVNLVTDMTSAPAIAVFCVFAPALVGMVGFALVRLRPESGGRFWIPPVLLLGMAVYLFALRQLTPALSAQREAWQEVRRAQLLAGMGYEELAGRIDRRARNELLKRTGVPGNLIGEPENP